LGEFHEPDLIASNEAPHGQTRRPESRYRAFLGARSLFAILSLLEPRSDRGRCPLVHDGLRRSR
jgi:hypothetical protein